MDASTKARRGDALYTKGARVGGVGAWIASLPWVPLPFLGLGVFRTWLHMQAPCVAQVPSALGTPALPPMQSDPLIVAVFLLLVLFARSLTPLRQHRWAWIACGTLLTVTPLFLYLPVILPVVPPLVVMLLRTLTSGVGVALMFLLWFELYGSLGPARVCLYYAASFVASSALSWLYQGFQLEWLPLAVALLPVASLRCLQNCYRRETIPCLTGGDSDETAGEDGSTPVEAEIPACADTGRKSASWAQFSFPWKPVLVIAALSFAYGLLQSGTISGAPHPSLTFWAILSSAVFAGALMLVHERAGSGAIYPVLAGLTALCLMLACIVGLPAWVSGVLVDWGYMGGQTFIMTMMAAICQRRHVNAIWLFGIERAVNTSAVFVGGLAEGLLSARGFPTAILLVVIVLVATLVALHEGRFGSAWGMRLAESQVDPEGAREVREFDSLEQRCAELARVYGLSQREEEVLLLLAQKKTARDIERELCVANGTAKAHIRHVYQKLDIHAREELFAMVEGRPTGR